MTSFISILLFIAAVSVLAALHELGHFLTSRLFKIEVEEFGFGLPPRALTMFRWQGTDFTLNWIPFGAFVRPKGEMDPGVQGGMGAAHPLKRLVILLGGPVMNLVAGMVLFSIIFLQTGVPDDKTVLINGIVQDSAAEKAGLKAGDILQKANGTSIDSIEKVRNIIQANPDKPVTFVIVRDGKVQELQATPKATPPSGSGILGVMLSNPVVQASWFQTIPMAFNVTVEYSRQVFILPVKLIMGQLPADQARLTGIVGAGSMFVQARERDIQSTETSSSTPAVYALNMLAIITIGMGIFNLLPIPALDGGRILFLLPELVLRRRIPAKYENAVHMVGFVALLALMFVITIQDIVNPVVLP